LVKASSRGFKELQYLLSTMVNTNTEKIKGMDLTKCMAVVLMGREDHASHEYISEQADVRIAWGGKESIEIVLGLKKKLFCEDIVFGPKYSYAVIDKSFEKNSSDVARRLAVDVSVFDQYACSSPHTVFVEGKKDNVIAFAQELAKQLEFVERTFLPKTEIDSGKSMEILTLRSVYALKGQVFSPKSTDWTVIYTERKGLIDGCASRVIFVKPIEDFKILKELNTRQKQTVGLWFSEENKLKYSDDITFYGVDRLPNIGTMTFFESPWDGMFVFDRLVRWITIHK